MEKLWKIHYKKHIYCYYSNTQSRGSVKGACSSPFVYLIGSYAMEICETCQVGNEAALNRIFHVL